MIIISKLSVDIHWDADDTQLYAAVDPDHMSHLHSLKNCMSDINLWMTQNVIFIDSCGESF